jgi:hypothetical protein
MSNPFANKSEEQIRSSWQGRALALSAKENGRMFRVLVRSLLNEYTGVTYNTWEYVLKLSIPGFVDLDRPLLLGYARAELSGRITTQYINRNGDPFRVAIYRDKAEFVSEMRRLADRLKLGDRDRTAMFDTLKKWITEDKSIGVHGEKLLS